MKCGKSIRGALSYNEQKVRAGKADLILASGFSCDVSDLSFQQKLTRFNLLNDRSWIDTNTIHISLNFPPGEILINETMQEIAANYMNRLGFSEQPYLVYEHTDTNHPHIHIITTPIKSNRRSINIHNLVQRKSEPARKAIELEYHLIRAENRKRIHQLPLKTASLNPVTYGRSETKEAISNIVREVTSTYKYGSLDELNAILSHYNIVADPGAITSTMHRHKGLLYSIVDKDGYKIGVPIKASAIYSGPTLKYIERQLGKNQVKRVRLQPYFTKTANYALSRSSTPDQFTAYLQKKNIRLSIIRDSSERVKEISFVDHSNRAVFNSRDIGLHPETILNKLIKPTSKVRQNTDHNITNELRTYSLDSYHSTFAISLIAKILNSKSNAASGGMDMSLKKKKKKKRRF